MYYIHSYDRAIALKPDYADAYSNRGTALKDLKRPEEALASYDRAIALKPDLDYILGASLHAKMLFCMWNNFQNYLNKLKEKTHVRLNIRMFENELRTRTFS